MNTISRDRKCKTCGIPEEFCLCAALESIDPPKKVIKAVMGRINELGHFRDQQCKRLQFLGLEGDENNRILIAPPNEYQYSFVFRTTFGRVFQSSVYMYTGSELKKRKKSVDVQHVEQLTQYSPATICSDILNQDKRVNGSVPPSFQFCACEDAYGESRE